MARGTLRGNLFSLNRFQFAVDMSEGPETELHKLNLSVNDLALSLSVVLFFYSFCLREFTHSVSGSSGGRKMDTRREDTTYSKMREKADTEERTCKLY